MSSIPKSRLSANLLAALGLLALEQLRELGLLPMSAKALLEALGATKSRAYEIAGALRERFHEVEAPRGRPVAATDTPCIRRMGMLAQISRDALAYLHEHPGATIRTAAKTDYSPGWLAFVVRQHEDNSELDIKTLASALALPATTVRDWVRTSNKAVEQAVARACDTDPASAGTDAEPPVRRSCHKVLATSRDLHIQTVLTQWLTWTGDSLSGFCQHLREHHRVALGRSAIASILELAGVRTAGKRPGRSPDEKGMRGAFKSFYPGAMWTADGCKLTIDFEGQRFAFNLELMVDTHSDAFVGVDVRDHEDADALIQAYEEGVETTSKGPVAVLLDNKPSNHAPAVHAAVGETLVIPATKARPQNKGHVEGAFGLFSQCAPPMQLDVGTPKERARQSVELCVRTFFGAWNMRPRANRGGRSRIDIYREKEPTSDELQTAIDAMQARLKKQLAAQETRRARQDPVKRAYLDSALERLGLSDPVGNFQATIARYDIDDIATGVAIFDAKKKSKALPDGVDIRYLWGVVKNVARKREGMALATTLWDERSKARDLVFGALIAKRNDLTKRDPDFDARLVKFVDEALSAERLIERHFWLGAVAELVLVAPVACRRSVFERVARQIHTAYRKPHEHREGALEVIAAKVLSLS